MQAIIDECKRTEKYKKALPILEDLYKTGKFGMYIAGSLMIRINDELCSYNVELFNGTQNDIFKRGQYLVSKIYEQHKKGCAFYDQALQNIKEYENEINLA